MLPVDYVISEKMKKAIAFEVEKLLQEMMDKNLIDEFSNGTCLDKFIHNNFNLIRNDLKKQQIKHQYMIENIKKMICVEVLMLEHNIKVVEQKILN